MIDIDRTEKECMLPKLLLKKIAFSVRSPLSAIYSIIKLSYSVKHCNSLKIDTTYHANYVYYLKRLRGNDEGSLGICLFMYYNLVPISISGMLRTACGKTAFQPL